LYWSRIEGEMAIAMPSDARSFGRAGNPAPHSPGPAAAPPATGGPRGLQRFVSLLPAFDFAQDLAEDVGSARWRRGLGVMLGLMLFTTAFWPSFSPLQAAAATRIDSPAQEEYAGQILQPLMQRNDSFHHIDANRTPGATMLAIAAAPERPRVELAATLGQGDSLSRMLQRAGVGSGDAARVSELVAGAVPLADVAPGTRVEVTLGARAAPGQPRPVDHVAFRARFDLALVIDRHGAALGLIRQPIAVDDTPLRVRGVAGSSLFLSARAAGVPLPAIQQYLQTLDAHMSLDEVQPGDKFDIVTAYKRSAVGGTEPGNLLYAGLEHDGQARLQLLRWGKDGGFLSAADMAGGTTTGLVTPVAGGHITSGYGMRFHPILGYTRMHAGVDFGAPYGSPIYAAADGFVSYAGVHGGHGNYVRLEHGSGMGSGYGHMSRIAVSPGLRVRAGDVIGYVGSTGLSTGPHLHYEVYEGGHTVDPLSVHFAVHAGVDKAQQASFKAQLAKLLLVKPGAAFGGIASAATQELPRMR
jgi:murein DD-endopeptidase MepM/ murein hydrolase activator NlpD